MAAEIVNLRKARKARDRVAKEKQAEENRAKFGRSKAERERAETDNANTVRRLDAHCRENNADDSDDEQSQ
jgi:hypothetical protein